MSYRLRAARSADAYLQRLDARTLRRILSRFSQIAADPFDGRYSKPLVNAAGARSARVGRLRILFFVDERAEAIEVTEIGPRGEVYRRL